MKKIKYFCLIGVLISKYQTLKFSQFHKYSIFICGIIILFLFYSCSVKKKSLSSRVYHNLSAHYNGYWNGNESYKDGLRELSRLVTDDYSSILTVYNYGTDQDAVTLTSYMDRAIQKASVVIQKHSMIFDKKEYNRWIDDCYMLIGKSYFYKGELISARRTFDFVIQEYKSIPAKYDAMLWLVRTYNRAGEFEKSEIILKEFQDYIEFENVPLKYQKDYPVVYSNFYLIQHKYDEAIEYLHRGIEQNFNKQLVTKLKFILAQIYFDKNDFKNASKLFTEVIHRNPTFEMAFRARINIARGYDAEYDDAQEIIKSLNALLNDLKNIDYLDQVYFAIAEIALKDNETAVAINNLRKSVSSSTLDVFQKVASSLMLADLYFEKLDYENAQSYYDTAMQVMPSDYPNYRLFKNKSEFLFSLIDNLNTIQFQDSVQYIAKLPESERNKIIDDLIQETKKKELQERKISRERSQNLAFAQQQNNYSRNNQQGGAWYFYNQSTLSFGYSEFLNKWGRRPLEDNWRLSQKQLISMDFASESDDAEITIEYEGDIKLNSATPKDRTFYLKDIPFTDEAISASNQKIKDALYNSAILYKEGLQEFEKSIIQFETLISRFPHNEFLVQSYYQLFRIYQHIDNKSKANYYKQEILSQFPSSEYAKIINDPQYFQKRSQQEDEVAALYLDTYQAFQNEQFYVTINLSDRAINAFRDSVLIPKFEYLKALSIGRIEVVDSLVVSLERIIDKYPESEIRPVAENLLNSIVPQIGSGISETTNDQPVVELESVFNYNPSTIHNYILIIKSENVNLNALKIRFSDFNAKYPDSESLNIISAEIDGANRVVIIAPFSNNDKAMNYFDAINEDEYVFSMLKPEEYDQYIISINNYSILIQNKNIDQYKTFYNKFYKY